MSFISNLQWRYATHRFNGKKLPANVVDKILEATRLTPSAFGIQPYHITVIDDDKLKAILKPKTDDQEQVTTCSHLMVFSDDSNITQRIDNYLKLAARTGRKDVTDDPEYDYRKEAEIFADRMGPEWAAKQVYIALRFALAACAELKVDSCPIEGFQPAAYKHILNLPKNINPKVVLAIGHRDASEIQLPKIRFDKADLFDFK